MPAAIAACLVISFALSSQIYHKIISKSPANTCIFPYRWHCQAALYLHFSFFFLQLFLKQGYTLPNTLKDILI